MFGLQRARDPVPLKHLAGARRGAALRCAASPLRCGCQLSSLPSRPAGGSVLNLIILAIRSAPTPCTPAPLTRPWASVLPRCPNAVSLCPCFALPCLPCLACHCCVFFCRSAPACCDRPPASAATPRPSTPIAVVQCGPPAAQSRQNSSTHRIASHIILRARPTDRPHGQLVREEREGGHQDQGTLYRRAATAERWGAAVAVAVAVSAHPIVHCDALTRPTARGPQVQVCRAHPRRDACGRGRRRRDLSRPPEPPARLDVDHRLQELDHRAPYDQRGRARGHLEVPGAEPHEETGHQFVHRGYVLRDGEGRSPLLHAMKNDSSRRAV